MKAWAFSLGLSLLSVAAHAGPLYYDCGTGKLDLACQYAATPSWKVIPLDARHADKAYVVKFGGPGREAGEPGWVVQSGSLARQALFWAAVLTVFIL